MGGWHQELSFGACSPCWDWRAGCNLAWICTCAHWVCAKGWKSILAIKSIRWAGASVNPFIWSGYGFLFIHGFYQDVITIVSRNLSPWNRKYARVSFEWQPACHVQSHRFLPITIANAIDLEKDCRVSRVAYAMNVTDLRSFLVPSLAFLLSSGIAASNLLAQ